MTTDIINSLKNARGDVFMEVKSLNDILWVKVVKSDLIRQLERFASDEDSGLEIVSQYKYSTYVAGRIR